MMNTWDFLDTVFSNRVDKAIIALEAMSEEAGSLVMSYLLEHETASTMDLLIQTRLDSETLDALLGTLLESGVLLQETNELEVHYFANRAKIGRICQLVARMNETLLVAS